MKKQCQLLQNLILIIVLVTSVSSCGTKPPALNYPALANAAIKLDIDIEFKDNHNLYLESAGWLGVPYRIGGTTKSGVDCSGLTLNIYSTVFDTKLKRNTTEQMKQSTKVSKRKLQEGDLVFFSSKNSKKQVAHVGIYLKDGKFVHASSSKGVIVSKLNEAYYKKYWIRGGRVN
ncbi:C40 family peptidase [Bacteroides sp. 519]|uniref:C40 family peptidase n=1 Tax=Bacteroides sp. 519 TaxID=2302937 RepID=UPI0013D71275|nr:NlpC/P60 family protein [Bacteroides sp. 519]NDV59181.1 NlpC/P60 family protein [Bacteroides sp. 519]